MLTLDAYLHQTVTSVEATVKQTGSASMTVRMIEIIRPFKIRYERWAEISMKSGEIYAHEGEERGMVTGPLQAGEGV